jgi:hypothetical protein
LGLGFTQRLFIKFSFQSTHFDCFSRDCARRKERQLQGIEAAKEKNKYTGRKSVITKDLIKTVEKYKNVGVSVT